MTRDLLVGGGWKTVSASEAAEEMQAILRDESGFSVVRDHTRVDRLFFKGASGARLFSLHVGTMKPGSGQMNCRFILNDGRVIGQVARFRITATDTEDECRVLFGGSTYATVHDVLSRRSHLRREVQFGSGGLTVDWSAKRAPSLARSLGLSLFASKVKKDEVGCVATVSSMDGARSHPPMVADPGGNILLACQFKGKGKVAPLCDVDMLDLLLLAACWAGRYKTTVNKKGEAVRKGLL